MSFRNRCVVAGGGGRVNLSIPLAEGRNQKKALKEVRIDNRTGWQDQHWKTITSCYNRSPWFEFYKDGLEFLYRQPAGWLSDWNRVCYEWVLQQLKAGGLKADDTDQHEHSKVGMKSGHTSRSKPNNSGIMTGYTDRYEATYDAALYLDWRNRLMPATIENEFPQPVRYRQVFEERVGFIPHLSILDLLFCEGQRTVEILKSGKIPS